MRLHTDNLSPRALVAAAHDAELDEVFVHVLSEHGSRTHRRAYEVRLSAFPGRDRNGKARRPMTNNASFYGAFDKAATYDEWGFWMAQVFDRDPGARFAGAYDGAEDFHQKTRYHYSLEG